MRPSSNKSSHTPKEPEPIFLPNLYLPPTRRSRRCDEESAIDIQIRGSGVLKTRRGEYDKLVSDGEERGGKEWKRVGFKRVGG